MKIQLAPWDPDRSVEMDAIFVYPELVKDEVVSPSQTKQVKLPSYENLFTFCTSSGIRVNRILVQGKAGSGTSTLLRNMAYKWAKQQGFMHFELVFFISISQILDKNNTLEEIIFDQILEDGTNMSQTGLKSYFKSNSQKCLFLVDGLDENSAGILNSEKSQISRLLHNKMYRKSCVSVSTHPDLLENIGCNISLMYKKVKLKGFSGENIEEYIKKYFIGNGDNHANLIKQLKEQPWIWNLAENPSLLMFFV